MTRVLVAAIVLAAAGCAAKRAATTPAGEEGAAVATYRVTFSDGDGATRHARLLLWAQAPDRLHAELLGPVGGVRFTLDAGDGRTCLVDASAGIAYVGDGGEAAVEAVAGVRVGVADVVAALLAGVSPPGLEVTRGDDPEGRLPGRWEAAQVPRRVSLVRVKIEKARAAVDLGTGRPPKGVPVRPLSDLAGRLAGESPE